MKTPTQYGQEAFSRNCPWNPQWDTEFMQAIATDEQKESAINQWKEGWIKESLTLPFFQ